MAVSDLIIRASAILGRQLKPDEVAEFDTRFGDKPSGLVLDACSRAVRRRAKPEMGLIVHEFEELMRTKGVPSRDAVDVRQVAEKIRRKFPGASDVEFSTWGIELVAEAHTTSFDGKDVYDPGLRVWRFDEEAAVLLRTAQLNELSERRRRRYFPRLTAPGVMDLLRSVLSGATEPLRVMRELVLGTEPCTGEVADAGGDGHAGAWGVRSDPSTV